MIITEKRIETLPDETLKCEKHGPYQAGVSIIGFLGDKKIYTRCPHCAKEEQAEREAHEAETKRRRQLAWFKAMNIGEKDYDTSFETFDPYTDELQKHLQTARTFAKHPEGKLVMLGNNGTGKDHLAVSVLKKTGGLIYTAFELFERLRCSYDGGEHKEWEFLEKLCRTSLLVIDELGRTKGSEWELNCLSHVVNKRHENLRPMIFITNKHFRRDCSRQGCSDCLQNYIGDDIISRIAEDGIIMKFTGEDYRYKQGADYRNRKRAEINKGA
jgi:DNA replication protein DnaC